MPVITPPVYPFDPTAMLIANKIINEIVPITVSNGINAFLIIPDAAPFYGKSLVLVNSFGATLVEGVDYYLTHHWQQGSDNTGFDVYGSITLIEGYPVDTYSLNYQTLGGEYVTTPLNVIQSGLIADSSLYINIDWATAPTRFPALPHNENLSGVVGVTQLYQGLYDIAAAIRSPDGGVHYNDIQDINEVYANDVVGPFITLIGSIALKDNAVAKQLMDIQAALFPLTSLTSVSKTLQHYTINLFGFQIKFGTSILFEVGSEPSEILFPGAPFANQCIFVMANVSFRNTTTPIKLDKIYTKTPRVDGVDIRIDYDSNLITGTRLITYLAIGN